MKQVKRLFIVAVMMFAAAVQVKAANQQKVLMVVSSYGEDAGETKPGYEFSEFSKAYLVFKKHGISVDIASPTGGKVVADQFDKDKPFNQTVLADANVMAKLNNTLAIKSVDHSSYQGIYIVGGKGAMFDFPNDEHLQGVIANIYDNEGVVAAVCHGPAALVNVKLSNGNYLVSGKQVNGFTNQEEKMFGKKWLKQFDFLLEDKLIERGGEFQHAPFMLSHVSVDERLVTAQNPSSTTASAIAMVKAMGIEVKPVKVYNEDATLDLVAAFLKGDDIALSKLADKSLGYQLPLVAMYGYYFSNFAEGDHANQQALDLMLVAQEALNNPRLDLQIAKSQRVLGKIDAAKLTLKKVIEATPDNKDAKEMLATL